MVPYTYGNMEKGTKYIGRKTKNKAKVRTITQVGAEKKDNGSKGIKKDNKFITHQREKQK